MRSQKRPSAETRASRWPDPAAVAVDLSGGRWQYAPHLELIADTLRDRILRGGARLIISTPPRHGKSELVSVYLPLWLLIHRPAARVILAAYGRELAAAWGRRVRNLVETDGPKLGLALSADSGAAHRWELTSGGGMLSAGVGGPVTGKGGDLVIVDDPTKSREEANSAAHRERVFEWFRSTLRTRFEPGASCVVIMQRWHEEDLVGQLLRHAGEDGEEWEELRLPAIAESGDPLGREPGEALWPWRYGVEDLEQLRASIGSMAWASQYQQRPMPAEGAIFRRKDFHYFREGLDGYELTLPDRHEARWYPKSHVLVFQVADTAMTARSTSDWTVCGTFALTPENDLLVLDIDRRRLEIPDQLGFLYAKRKEFPELVWQGIEPKSSGIGLVQQAARDGRPFHILEGHDVDKVTRATPASILAENGKLFFREEAPWLSAFEDELLAFDRGAHDDQVDVLAYAALQVGRVGRGLDYGAMSDLRDRRSALERAEDLREHPEDRDHRLHRQWLHREKMAAIRVPDPFRGRMPNPFDL